MAFKYTAARRVRDGRPGVGNGIEDSNPLCLHKQEWVGDDEVMRLKSTWQSIADDIEACDAESAGKRAILVAERMRSIPGGQFYDITSSCFCMLKNNFMGGILSRQFANPEAFKAYAMSNISGMNILGNAELEACLIPPHCAYLEADALTLFRKCGRKFRDEGRDDFAAVADELTKLMIDQIESENGLTRRYMRADLKLQRVLVDRGFSTREKVLRGVRADAYPLKVAGYFPKWLSEFDDLSEAEK